MDQLNHAHAHPNCPACEQIGYLKAQVEIKSLRQQLAAEQEVIKAGRIHAQADLIRLSERDTTICGMREALLEIRHCLGNIERLAGRSERPIIQAAALAALDQTAKSLSSYESKWGKVEKEEER